MSYAEQSSVKLHGSITRPEPGTGFVDINDWWCCICALTNVSSIKLHFKDSKGESIKTVEANEGDDILSIAHEHDIDLEGKAHFLHCY